MGFSSRSCCQSVLKEYPYPRSSAVTSLHFLGRAEAVDGVAEDALVCAAEGGDAAGGAVGSFLYAVACVAFGPLPGDAVGARGLV